MQKFSPKTIFVLDSVQNIPYTQKIIRQFPHTPQKILSQNQILNLEKQFPQQPDPISYGKQFLLISQKSGPFLKKCPGTHGELCCNYYVINLIQNCHLECSYCFLQNYLNQKMIVVYVNLHKLFQELDQLLNGPKKLYRIGTGELSDSLALDSITCFSKPLIHYFSQKNNALLELKTKTANVSHILKLQHQRRTVISWSLSPIPISKNEELKTSSILQRIQAAKLCQNAGYQVGFHFDPIFYTPNWKSLYQNLIDLLFDHISPLNVPWISLGSLRFHPATPTLVQQRFPLSSLFQPEFLPSSDGKIRYFAKIRQLLFSSLKSMILKKNPHLMVYLCMEPPYMWNRVFGFVPKGNHNLDQLFQKRQSLILQNSSSQPHFLSSTKK